MSSIQKTIVEGTLYLSLSNTLVKLFSLVSYVIIVSRLDLYDYGIFVLLTSLSGPAAVFVFFGFNQVFFSNFAQAKGSGNLARMKGLVREYYGLSSLLLFCFIIGVYIMRKFLVQYYDIYILHYFWELSFFILSQLLLNMVLLLVNANEQFKQSSFLASLESISRSFLVIIFAGGLSAQSVLIIYASAKSIAVLVGLFYFIKLIIPLIKTETPPEKKVLLTIFKSHGKWEIIRVILEQASNPLKLWLIKIFVNVQSVAVVDFAQNMYGTILGFFPVQSVIFPIISRVIGTKELVGRIILKAKKYSLIFYALFFTIVAFVLPYLLQVLFPQYSGYTLFILFVLLHVFTQVYRMGQPALLYALNQQKFLVQIFPLLFVVELIFYIVLTYFWGIWGAVLSWHVHVIATGFIVAVFLKRKYHMDMWVWKDFFSFDEYDKMLLSKITTKIKGIVGL